MVAEIVLLYFEGCPNAAQARALLERIGFPFSAVDQLSLSKDDPRRDFASPTILFGKVILYGSKTSSGSEGCSISPFNEGEIEELLRVTQEKIAIRNN